MTFYTFQELTAEEILVGLSDAKINATLQMLNQPKPINVYNILKSFFLVISNFEESELSNPHFMVTESLDKELVQGYTFLNFYRGMKDLMKSSGINDFSFQDLYKPNSKRFQYLLSGLISFAIFREDRVRTFTEHNKKATELKSKNIEIMNEIKSIEEKIKEQKQNSENQQHEIEVLKSKKIGLEINLNEIQDGNEDLRNNIKKLEKETLKIQNQIDITKKEVETKREKINEFNERLSLSPEEVAEKEKKLKEIFKKESIETTEYEEKLSLLKKRLNMLTNVRLNLITAVDKLLPIGKNMKNLSILQEKKKLLEDEKQEYQTKLESIQKLRNQKTEIEKEQKQEANERRDIVSKIKEYKKTLRRLDDDHKTRIEYGIGDKIELIRHRIQEFNDSLNQSMREFDMQK